jgi:hypothetical protein
MLVFVDPSQHRGGSTECTGESSDGDSRALGDGELKMTGRERVEKIPGIS